MDDLELLVQEAAAAKERARIKALRDAQRARNTHGSDPHKEEITPVEYVNRRNRMLFRDASLLKEVKQDRINKSSVEWQKRVGATFANAKVEDPRILQRVSRIGDENGRHRTSLIFNGTMGSGKSWHCYSYINLAIQLGKVTAGQIMMGTETDVLGKIAGGGFKRSELLEELTNPRFQIYYIDDVGQGYFSREDSRTEVWYELIDHVYTHQLTLLLTTNLPVTDAGLGFRVGKRAFDRLKTIVGSDGVIEPGKVNKREGVAERNDARLNGSSNG